MAYLQKYHGQIVAAGLLCLAAYYLTIGDFPHCLHAALTGLGLLGIHLGLPDPLEHDEVKP